MLRPIEVLLSRFKSAARFLLNDGRSAACVWYLIGTSLESLGMRRLAVRCLDHAIRRADRSRSNAAFTVRQRWEYRSERLRHVLGQPRVEDPLFACRADADTSRRVASRLRRRAPGYYEVEWTHRGLRIDGFLSRHDPGTRIRVRVNGFLLRELLPVKAPLLPPFFQFVIQRAVAEQFWLRSRLTLELADGRELLCDGCTAVSLHIPHANSDAGGFIARGGAVDKKGALISGDVDLLQRQTDFLRIYSRARAFFDERIGTPLFILYGTLLGVHRQGDFIPGDDDFDVGYVSRHTRSADVRREAMDIVVELVRAGFVVSFNRKGRLCRLRLPDCAPEVHLDVHTVWRELGALWIHPQARLNCTLDDFLPVGHASLRGTDVHVPNRPEAFLAAYYGSDWRIPNPAYTTAAARTPRWVRNHLGRSLVSPRHYADMREAIGTGGSSGSGRLISIGSHPLYPLDEYVAQCDW